MDMEATRHSLGQLSELIVTPDMHDRKHKMFERADAFVTLPGGIGTLEEIVEIMTWAQLGRHRKPIVLVNINGFWDPMMTLVHHMADAGFIHTAHLVQPLVIDAAEESFRRCWLTGQAMSTATAKPRSSPSSDVFGRTLPELFRRIWHSTPDARGFPSASTSNRPRALPRSG